MRHITRALLGGAVASLLLAGQAFSQGIDGAPAPFDKGGVRIAVVSFLGSGDWLQAFESGVKRQGDALGVELTFSQARNDHDTQRSLVEQAINLGVDGIVINNGRPETLQDVAQKALDAGIKVVAYDVDLDNPAIAQIEQSDADMARHHAEVFLDVLRGQGFAEPNPQPMFPNPPGLLRLEPHSEGLRERIWWGAATNATAVWAAELGMNLQSSTLKFDETGEPFHVQQAQQIRAYRQAWKEAGHTREPRVSVSRSIFALMDDRDRMYFGQGRPDQDKIGFIEAGTRAIFGRNYAAEPDVLVRELAQDEAIAEADTLLLTVPNQLGVDYNAHVIGSILKHVAPALGWR